MFEPLDFTKFAESIKNLTLRFVEIGLLPEAPPRDPRERASWLKKNRNTGPARPHSGKK